MTSGEGPIYSILAVAIGAGTHVGTLGGRYQLIRVLGRGAHAHVWQARHTFLDLNVAVKVQRHTAPADTIAREGRMLARLGHRAFVRVLDGGVHSDANGRVPFLVEELLSGQTIREILVDGPLSPDRVIEIGTEITEATRVANAVGIVIRDIKPSNVMITCQGEVKMIDLGLACAMGKAADDDEDAISGTWSYLPPEAIATGHIGPFIDQYAIATTLYEMLACRHPRADGNGALPKRVETLRRARYSRTPPRIDGLPGKLMDVLAKALSPEPSRRFLDLADFGAALRDAG